MANGKEKVETIKNDSGFLKIRETEEKNIRSDNGLYQNMGKGEREVEIT
jgi:hypothetical protein